MCVSLSLLLYDMSLECAALAKFTQVFTIGVFV